MSTEEQLADYLNKKAFLSQIENFGFKLSDFALFVDEVSYIQYSYSIVHEEKTWTIYFCDERHNLCNSFQGNESESFTYFYDIAKSYIYRECKNHSITRNVVFTEKNSVYDYFHANFQMTDREFDQSWENLTKNFHVLNEVKYYSLTGNFVPAVDAYRVKGYTAEELFTNTRLNVIGAYNYLIYLCEKPHEALDYLSKGLPVH